MASTTETKTHTINNGPIDATKLGADENEYFLPTSAKTKKLPDWLDHFNLKDLKVLFKCSLAAWVMTLLIVINPTLRAIGQAAFFGVIVIFLAPPSGVVLVGFMAIVMLTVGVCLGWAWGVITMKAALATRPAADLQRQFVQLQQAASQNTTNTLQASGQATFQQVAIFDGFMLDTRVTITYFCMLGLFIYLVARLRVAAPKLALVQMFAIIVTDIFLTIAPLIPQFSGTIPRTLIVPVGVAAAIILSCNILFFPKSTSHIVLDDMEKMLEPMNMFLEACSQHFATPSLKMNLSRLKFTKGQIIQTYTELEQNLKFLALDVSVCRWSAGDIKSLHDPLRQVLVSFIALLQVQVSRLEFQLKDEELLEMAEKVHDGDKQHDVSGAYQLTRAFDLRMEYRNEERNQAREAALRQFAALSDDLLSACQQALFAAREGMRECNNRRWFGRLSDAQCETMSQAHNDVLQDFKRHKELFVTKVASSLWSNNAGSVSNGDPSESKVGSSKSRKFDGLVYTLIMEERLIHFANETETLLGRIVALEHDRKRCRFWSPRSLKDVIPLALESDSRDTDLEPKMTKIQTVQDEKKGQGKGKGFFKKKDKGPQNSAEKAALAAMQHRGGRQRNKGGKVAIAVAHWFSSTEGLYALRVLIVSMSLGAIAVNTHTAGFFYREKGLWGLIMAQTALTPYTADFVYGLVLRLAGTVLGAIIGLAAWYIGAGNGPGSPYGIAAVMAPIIIVAMWLRLFTSPAFLQGVVLTTATVYLVVAYSWIDTHIPSYGNPGVGYAIFWRRMLLVIIGFGVAAFVTLFPRPPSANRHYRRVLSTALQSTKDQYALLIACKSSEHQPEDVRKLAEKTAIELGGILLQTEPQTKLAKLELSTSNIDSETLGLVCHLCMNLNQYVTQMIIHSTVLPSNLKQRFFNDIGVSREQIVADIMAVLTIAQHALMNGDPLPTILPVPLMERFLKDTRSRITEADLDLEKMNESVSARGDARRFFSALAAFVQFLGSLDELVLVVKRAVGESSYMDLEA